MHATIFQRFQHISSDAIWLQLFVILTSFFLDLRYDAPAEQYITSLQTLSCNCTFLSPMADSISLVLV
ncbi:hypothetical protein QL285_053386 [Trifolium repens]|nr:hypothetical protein QL285_053386 [Trifolium repens]